MVAEEQIHLRLAALVAVDVVQARGAGGGKYSLERAVEVRLRGATEHAFIGCHPADAFLVREPEDFLGDAAFRGPHAVRTHAEGTLMQIEAAADLLAGIFGVAKTIGER